jgi:hypothetical protein
MGRFFVVKLAQSRSPKQPGVLMYFQPMTLNIKTPKAAFEVIKGDIVPNKDKHRFARAIIGSESVPHTLDLLIDGEMMGIKFSPTWRRYAAQVILRKGDVGALMEAFSVLPAVYQLKKVRAAILEKILRCDHHSWLLDCGLSPQDGYPQFWRSKFTPEEVELIYRRVLKIGHDKGHNKFLYLSANAEKPFLSDEQAETIRGALIDD